MGIREARSQTQEHSGFPIHAQDLATLSRQRQQDPPGAATQLEYEPGQRPRQASPKRQIFAEIERARRSPVRGFTLTFPLFA